MAADYRFNRQWSITIKIKYAHKEIILFFQISIQLFNFKILACPCNIIGTIPIKKQIRNKRSVLHSVCYVQLRYLQFTTGAQEVLTDMMCHKLSNVFICRKHKQAKCYMLITTFTTQHKVTYLSKLVLQPDSDVNCTS